MNSNILLAGMGGQGLVLMTDIICEAALKAGYDVKSNDVVGLSQRGGTVWGNVRIGEEVHSPNVRTGHGDFLLAMEPLEGLRWKHILHKDGQIIMNTKRINPVLVQQEMEEYPEDLIGEMLENYDNVQVNAFEEGIKIGTSKVANVILIGALANKLNETEIKISDDHWIDAIYEFVPPKAKEMNLEAFKFGKKL